MVDIILPVKDEENWDISLNAALIALRDAINDVEARANAAYIALDQRLVELETGSENTLQTTARYQVNPQTNATPQYGQVAGNADDWATASELRFWHVDRNNVDQTVPLAHTIRLYGQKRDNANYWIRYDVTADPVNAGEYTSLPVAFVSAGSGNAAVVDWQEMTFVFEISAT